MGKDNKTNKKKPSKKGGKSTGPDAVAMKAKAQKADNPFESIWSRRKFDVLGKKRKGEERRIGVSRSRAVDKRKNTLLKEYEQSLKASVFKDKRIGEENDELGEFDKAIIRSQRERQMKLGKKSMYNLSDGEEDIYEDGALGGSSGRDDFDSGLLSDEDLQDEDLEAAGPKRLKHLNRNRPIDSSGEEERHKSKKEVMEEIIMKSKLGRMEKAKEKEEKEKLIDELDKSFKSLVDSRVMESLTRPFDVEQGEDNYKKLMADLSMDRRGRPSERVKTPEEIAEEELEKLEALEEKRKKRMQETEDSSDGDEESDDEESKKRPRGTSGDDLGDSFSVDEEQPKKGWIDNILGENDDASSEDSESEGGEDDADADADDDDDESDEGGEKQQKGHPLEDWEQSDNELGAELEEDGDDDDDDDDEDETKFDAKMRNQVLNRRKEVGDAPSQPTQKKKTSSLKGREEPIQRPDVVSSEDEKPKMEKLSLKKKGIGSEAKAERMEKGDVDLQLYNASERARQLHKLKKRRLQGNEDAVLAKLEKFKQSISAKPFTSSSGPVVKKEDLSEDPSVDPTDDLSDWKKVKLKFAPEHGKDKMSRKDDPDAYVVVDPLLEKGKEKFNRMQAKQKRREREWSGKSLA